MLIETKKNWCLKVLKCLICVVGPIMNNDGDVPFIWGAIGTRPRASGGCTTKAARMVSTEHVWRRPPKWYPCGMVTVKPWYQPEPQYKILKRPSGDTTSEPRVKKKLAIRATMITVLGTSRSSKDHKVLGVHTSNV